MEGASLLLSRMRVAVVLIAAAAAALLAGRMRDIGLFQPSHAHSDVKVTPWALDRLDHFVAAARGFVVLDPRDCTIREMRRLKERWTDAGGRFLRSSELLSLQAAIPLFGFRTEADTESDRHMLEAAGYTVAETHKNFSVAWMLRWVPSEHWLLVAVQEAGLEGLSDKDRSRLAEFGLNPPASGPYVGLGRQGWKRGLEGCCPDGRARFAFEQGEQLWPGGPRAPVPLSLVSSEAPGWNAQLNVGSFNAVRWRREYWNWATTEHHRGVWFAEMDAETGAVIQYFLACYFEGKSTVTVRFVKALPDPAGRRTASGPQS